MNDLWLISSCLGLLIPVLIIHIVIIGKHHKKVNFFIQEIGTESDINTDNITIVILNHSSPYFKEIDELLPQVSRNRLVVIFYAPDWLKSAKSKTWKQHHVLNGNKIAGCAALKGDDRIIVKNGCRIHHISHPIDFLRLLEAKQHRTAQ